MFKRLFASNRSLRRRTMTPGALVLSSAFHGTLLAGAVYATVPSAEESGKPLEPLEFVTYLELPEPPPPAETGSTTPVGAPGFVPPQLLPTTAIDGQVIAEFIVLPDGTVDLTSVKLVDAPHSGFEAATRAALGRLRFTPGRFAGEPVSSVTRLPITWRVGG